MRRRAMLVTTLIVTLGLLTALAYYAISDVTGDWFRRDVASRARLAVSAASSGLSSNWESPARLRETLSDITRDDRILGAAACTQSGELRASTQGFPQEFSCHRMLAR